MCVCAYVCVVVPKSVTVRQFLLLKFGFKLSLLRLCIKRVAYTWIKRSTKAIVQYVLYIDNKFVQPGMYIIQGLVTRDWLQIFANVTTKYKI